MTHRGIQTDQQRDGGEPATGDQRQHARRRVALPKVGEHVQARDEAEDDEGRDVELEVARNEKDQGQVFAGVPGPLLLTGGSWMSCDKRSSGTGKTITVLRSTPISVSVCR